MAHSPLQLLPSIRLVFSITCGHPPQKQVAAHCGDVSEFCSKQYFFLERVINVGNLRNPCEMEPAKHTHVIHKHLCQPNKRLHATKSAAVCDTGFRPGRCTSSEHSTRPCVKHSRQERAAQCYLSSRCRTTHVFVPLQLVQEGHKGQSRVASLTSMMLSCIILCCLWTCSACGPQMFHLAERILDASTALDSRAQTCARCIRNLCRSNFGVSRLQP